MRSLIWPIAMLSLAASVARPAEAPADAASIDFSAIDELQWLEPPAGERAVSWARQATAESQAKLRSLPDYPRILRDLQHTLETAPVLSGISLLGPFAVRLHRDTKHPKGLLQRADRRSGSVGAWTTVLDVAALGAEERADYDLQWSDESCLPPAFDRCLLSFSVAGGDAAVLREFDLAAARFVDGGFSLPPSRHTAAWLDRNTIVIGHDLGGARTTAALWPAEASLWRRGTTLQRSQRVFEAGAADVLFQLHPLGGNGRALLLQAVDFSTFNLHLIDVDDGITRLQLPSQLKIFGFQGATLRHVFVQLAQPAMIAAVQAPAETILSYDLDARSPAPRVEIVYTPAAGEVITSLGFATTRTRMIFPVRTEMKLRLLSARRGGESWRVSPLVSAPAGVELRVTGADPVGEQLATLKEGFLVPPAIGLLNEDGSSTLVEQSPPLFDASKLDVEVRRALTGDDEMIDYFLIAPRQRAGGRIPTLVTGYGAFGISLSPAYPTTMSGQMYGGATLKLWFERGGALALPAIRGGGERGEAWHRAAMGENRQVSYDDLYAVAADIVRSGISDRAHMGVFGTSNGGLLAAVAGVQQPDLFGAVIADAPLTDMLRFVDMGMGAAWVGEYGDPKDPLAAAWLARYSPLHNVTQRRNYPAFLITVSTTDNRVGPGHARKLAKRLKDVGANVLFLEAETGGHAVSDPLLQPDMMAMRAAFLFDRLHQ
jgi:prolyl oligopeptidase